MTSEFIGDTQIGDQGGERLLVRLSDPLNINETARLRVVKLTAPGEYETVAEVLNGRPGETETIGDTEVYLMPAFPSDPAEPTARMFLRGYSPRLAPGIYYVQVERKADSAWTAQCVTSSGFRVYPRLRHQEVYDHRRLFPSPPFLTGPQSLTEEPT